MNANHSTAIVSLLTSPPSLLYPLVSKPLASVSSLARLYNFLKLVSSPSLRSPQWFSITHFHFDALKKPCCCPHVTHVHTTVSVISLNILIVLLPCTQWKLTVLPQNPHPEGSQANNTYQGTDHMTVPLQV